MKSVYSAVRTGSLNSLRFVFKELYHEHYIPHTSNSRFTSHPTIRHSTYIRSY